MATETVLSFNKTINKLISRLEKRSITPQDIMQCDRLKQRINLLRSTLGGQELLNLTGPFLYKYSEEIISGNEIFFLKLDIRQAFSKEIKKNDETILAFIDNVRDMYKRAKDQERNEVKSEVLSLHTDYIGYCIEEHKDPSNPRV